MKDHYCKKTNSDYSPTGRRSHHRHRHHATIMTMTMTTTSFIIIIIILVFELCFCFCMTTVDALNYVHNENHRNRNSNSNNSRKLSSSTSSSSLQDRFDISVPTFNQLIIDDNNDNVNNKNNNYTLTYEVSNYITDNQIARFELYDKGCKDNNDNNGGEGGEGQQQPNVPISSTTILPTTLQYYSNSNDDSNIIQLNIDIDPNKFMYETTIFSTTTTTTTTDDDNSGTLEFCVRFELVLEETIVVNFLETIIVLQIDLLGEFTVDATAVAAKIKKEKYANEGYGVVANFCDEYHRDFIVNSQQDYEQWVSSTQPGRNIDDNGGICIDGVYIDPLLEYKKSKLNSNYTTQNNNDDNNLASGYNSTSTNSTSNTTEQRNNNNDDDDFINNINEFEIEWNPKVIYNQGSVVRICVRPNQIAQENGIKMRRIEYFNFYIDDDKYKVQQKAVISGGRPAFNGLTEYFCTSTLDLCVIETILIADFYQSPGTTLGEGLAHLQFGDGKIQQRQRQRQTRRRNRRNNNHLRYSISSSSSSSSSLSPPTSPDNNSNGSNSDVIIIPPTTTQSEEEELLLLLKSAAARSPDTRTTHGRISDDANFLDDRQLVENNDNENDEEEEEEVPLETLWNLTSTGFSHDGITFQLSYMLSDAISKRQIQTSWLDSNCRHPINNLNNTMKIISYENNTVIVGDGGDGFGLQSLDIDIELEPNYVSNENSNIYKETSTGDFAQIQFCLRLSLYKYYFQQQQGEGEEGEEEEIIIEVNFLENPIFLNVDLQSPIGLNFTTTEDIVCEEDNDTSDARHHHHYGFLLLSPRWQDIIVNGNNTSSFLTLLLTIIQTSYFLFG